MAQTLTDNLNIKFPVVPTTNGSDKDRINALENDVAQLKQILNQWVNVQLRPVIGVGGILKPSFIYSGSDPTTYIQFPFTGIKIFQGNREQAGWPV